MPKKRNHMGKQDMSWDEYSLGTKAYAVNGGYWIRIKQGWKWCTGATFPTPGGDAIYIELPENNPRRIIKT